MWDGAKVEKVGKSKVGAEHDSSHFSPCQSLTGIRILTKVDVTKIYGGKREWKGPALLRLTSHLAPKDTVSLSHISIVFSQAVHLLNEGHL